MGFRGQKNGALGISLLLHVAAFFGFLQAPRIEIPHASESEYKQAIAGKEQKIVWYKFRKELPAVRPVKATADKRPLRAEKESAQAIVSAPKEAPKRDQMVWTAAPAIAAPSVESPNILAVKLPELPFVAPDAPEIKPAETATAQVPTALPPRPFVEPPAAPKQSLATPRLAADAPVLQAQSAPELNALTTRLPPRPYTAPPGTRRAATSVTSLAEAPQLAASIIPGGSPAGTTTRLPPRPFMPPTSGGKASAGKAVTVDAAPPMEANSRELNLAVVGLNPVDKPGPPPSASSPGAFSSGPKLNPNGATSEGAGKGLTVPDLFVRGPREAKPDLLAQAYAAPTSPETIRAAMRGGEPMMTARVPAEPVVPHSTATKVSGAPDPRFNGRDVFMMAIQMPNLTSYSGSWLMWYSDHTAREAGMSPIAAPVPHRKVDPKYIATAAEERVEGDVTLGCVINADGHVSSVELIRGIDSRLNQSAIGALAKWEFYPAMRNGVPVVVDVLVQIPFRLPPKLPRR
jgi:TonB family protein